MSIAVLNTDSDLSAKTIVTAEGDRTITGNFTFSRSPSAPFTVPVGSAVVTNLDANFLQGQLGSFYRNASNLNTGTVPTAQLGSGGASVTTFLRGDSSWAAVVVSNSTVNGRLTLTTLTPVTTADVTAATTIFFTPYQGKYITLFDGASTWNTIAFSEISIAVPATTSQMYDVFCFSNAGVATLELLAWTNDTTRATALVLQDGVLVKTGATTRRYLGSFRTTTVSGQTEDSVTKRYLWNYYNRVVKQLLRLETTATWAYTTATIRQANGSTSNQVDVVVGWAEVQIDLTVTATASNGNSDGTNMTAQIGIGEDSTSTFATGLSGGSVGMYSNSPFASYAQGVAKLVKSVPVGRHFYSWNEWSQANGGTTWRGTPVVPGGPSGTANGLNGTIQG